jgi:Domain of Unknown Function with PDB structure (DUF3857)
MKIHLCVFFLAFSCQVAFAQTEIPEFGDIALSDLTMKECPFEKNASAMNLIKTAKLNFQTTLTSFSDKTITEFRTRIKIFNEHGFSSANIKIPYVSEGGSSKITDIEAFVYNLGADGKIVKEKVERKQIFKDKSKAEIAFNSVSFTFPDLKNGSIIEYRYTKVDKNELKIEPWYFQDDLPTAVSDITITVPDFFRINHHFVTFEPVILDSFLKKNSGHWYTNDDIYYMTMNNVPSFKIEPYMGALADNLERVEFSFSERVFLDGEGRANWFYYNNRLLRSRHFGKVIVKAIPGTEKIIDSIKKLIDRQSKISSAFSYVKNNLNWSGEYTFYCDSIEEALKNRQASSAEMNILFINLLKKVGIRCFPALVSTKENGMTDEGFPSLDQFNSVVAVVSDSNAVYVIDCSQKGLPYTIPPLNILNHKALLVDSSMSQWVNIADKRILMKNEVNTTIYIDSNGNASGQIGLALIGYAKSEELTRLEKKKNDKSLFDSTEDVIVDSAYTIPSSENCDTLVRRVKFHFTPSNTGKSYFLNPFVFTYFSKNPFKDTVRMHDIDFDCSKSYSMAMHLFVADNFSIEDLPKMTSIRLPDSAIFFRREVFMENNEILIRIKFVLNEFYFPKEDYRAIKIFFDKVYALVNEEILFKKKN